MTPQWFEMLIVLKLLDAIKISIVLETLKIEHVNHWYIFKKFKILNKIVIHKKNTKKLKIWLFSLKKFYVAQFRTFFNISGGILLVSKCTFRKKSSVIICCSKIIFISKIQVRKKCKKCSFCMLFSCKDKLFCLIIVKLKLMTVFGVPNIPQVV